MKRALSALLVAAMVAAPFAVQAQEKGKTEKKGKTAVVSQGRLLSVLPSDTALVVLFSNASQFVTKFKETPFYRLKDLKELASFRQLFDQFLTQFRGKAREELDIDPMDALKSIQGEVLIAYGSPKPVGEIINQQFNTGEMKFTTESLRLLVAFDAGAKKDVIAGVLKKLVGFARKNGAKVDSKKFQNGQLTAIQPEAEKKESVYLGEHGSHVTFTTSRKFAEEVLVALESKKEAGLEGVAHFKKTYNLAGKGSDFFVFLNLKSVVGTLDSAFNATLYGFFWQKFRDVLFGKSLNNLGVGFSLDGRGLKERVFLHNNGAKDGLPGWFYGKDFAPKPVGAIPEDAGSFSSISFNPAKIIDTIRDLGQFALSFQGGGDLDAIIEQNVGVKLDDLKRGMGGRIHTFATEGFNAENPVGDLTVILELNDKTPFEKILSKAQQMLGGALEGKKHLEKDYMVIVGADPMSPSLCVSDQHLIFSMKESTLKKVMSRLGKSSSVAGGKSFQALKLPPKVSYLQFTSKKYIQNAMSSYVGMIEQVTGQADNLPPGFAPAMKALMEALGSTFDDTIAWGRWQDGGFYMEATAGFAK